MKRIILSLAVLLFSLGSFAQNNQGAIISVEGKSLVKLMPEDLSFTVNLSVKDNNYTKCAEMAVEKMDNIKKLFVKNGIDKDLLKANNYSIREIQKYDPELRQSVFDGYEANIPVTIRTKRDYKKNDKIFELIKDNLESNFNLNFSLSEEQMNAVKEKLITLAVQDARQKAEWIAKASGTTLGKIKNIQYGEAQRSIGPTQPELRMFAMMDQAKSSAQITDVLNPDEVEMNTNIFISWEINQ
ncbi:SIMPL domain-containing protein [Maribellus sp. YY47]|uniref:SIMPL domain-containing protein n=1 Tax=Maribellus sp. YY47 TaxID=2929486 RepID=UPI0020007166|nr:SIMPL domain-containing protein [Maribellus sp. YY47]MCK3684316.1 SIMPL domain-containing protein [Maribellus sp. YY47]